MLVRDSAPWSKRIQAQNHSWQGKASPGRVRQGPRAAGQSHSREAAQGEAEGSAQVLGCAEQGDLEQGTAELSTSTSRAQPSHELRPPGLS